VIDDRKSSLFDRESGEKPELDDAGLLGIELGECGKLDARL
jgi:hypothetical protein